MSRASSASSDPGRAEAWSPGRALATGTLMVGVLDACLALVFWGLRGGRPLRIFQSIAAGLLGRASYGGGLPTATLGLLLHFFIAGCIVTTYYLASRRIEVLTRRPIACGLVYGVGVYFFMSRVVIPLSAVPPGRSFDWPWFWASVMGHALLVGLPSALVAQRVPARDRSGSPNDHGAPAGRSRGRDSAVGTGKHGGWSERYRART